MIKFLDLYSQYKSIKSEIDEAIIKTIENSDYIGGDSLSEFESAFASYQQVKFCVGVGNGTDAIEIALEALNLPDSSEIIVPANSFIASSESVTRSGHKVVFADVYSDSYTLNVEDVERRITSKTSAIMAVHLYGHSCDMEGLGKLAEKYSLKIIEDCAQAHGAEYKGSRVGGIGDIATFSFYPGKNLGAYGDGGAIVTNNEKLASLCRMIANHGRISKNNHKFEGRNSRLDALQAAILSVKLKQLDIWIEKRNYIAKRYIEGMKDIDNIVLPVVGLEVRHAFHLFVIRTKDRNGLSDYLKKNKIQTGIHYPVALPKLDAYLYLNQEHDKTTANSLDSQLLSLPIGEHLTSSEINDVISSVRKYYGNT